MGKATAGTGRCVYYGRDDQTNKTTDVTVTHSVTGSHTYQSLILQWRPYSSE